MPTDDEHLTVYPDGRRPEQNPGLLTSRAVLFCFLLLGMYARLLVPCHSHTHRYISSCEH